MSISTQDCKDFILSISAIIQSSANNKWKRIKKYKEESFTLRDFENQDGQTLTIAEHNGQLFLYQLSSFVGSINAKVSLVQNVMGCKQCSKKKMLFLSWQNVSKRIILLFMMILALLPMLLFLILGLFGKNGVN